LAKQERLKLREQRKAELAAKQAAEAAAAAAAVDAAVQNLGDGADAVAAAVSAVAGNNEAQGTVLVEGRVVLWSHRKKKGKMWQCFDLSKEAPSCILPSSTGVGLCGVEPSFKGGTSNGWDHLYRHHRPVWLRMKKELGQLTGVGDQELQEIEQAFKARQAASSTATTMPPLPAQAKAHLDSLASLWVVDTDQHFNCMEHAAFQKMQQTATSGAWCGCCGRTVASNVTAMADEGRADCRDFVGRVRADGRKVVASADLWSKNGVALLGSLMHAIERPGNRRPWVCNEKLASAKPCAQDRHTGEYVKQASFEEWEKVGVANPSEDLFAAKTDRGSNMIKGYDSLNLSPCVEHVYQRHARKFADNHEVGPTLKMGRAMVGALNHSTIGNNDYQVCRKECGLAEKQLVQEVVTRWRSTHDMAESLREGQTPMLIYDAKYEKKPDGLVNNMYGPANWAINNQACAQLAGLASASKTLEATKGQPTSNLVLPYTYGAMATVAPDVKVVQYWDGKSLEYGDLRSEVKAARAEMLQDMEDYWYHLPEDELRLYQACSFFDPRIKKLKLPLVDNKWREDAFTAIKADYEMHWAPNATEEASDSPPVSTDDREKENETQPTPSMGNFSDFMATVSHLTQQEDEDVVVEEVTKKEVCEYEEYLNLPQVSMQTDILEWWGVPENEERFPNLARMAAQYLGVPASSAAAERVFSISGRIYGDLSQNMNAVTLEERMFAKINTGRRKV